MWSHSSQQNLALFYAVEIYFRSRTAEIQPYSALLKLTLILHSGNMVPFCTETRPHLAQEELS
jgi:hypothetical protein